MVFLCLQKINDLSLNFCNFKRPLTCQLSNIHNVNSINNIIFLLACYLFLVWKFAEDLQGELDSFNFNRRPTSIPDLVIAEKWSEMEPFYLQYYLRFAVVGMEGNTEPPERFTSEV